MDEKIIIDKLIEQKASKLFDGNGRLIGRKASDNAAEYLALESFRGDDPTRQAIVGQIGTLCDNYKDRFDEEPPLNVLGAAVGAIEGLSSVLAAGEEKNTLAMESVSGNLTTVENIAQILNIQNTLAMEHELFGILNQVAVSLPSSVDETNLFELERKATKNWGNISAGADLGLEFSGGLSELNPALSFDGDGATTDFPLTAGHPVAKEATEIFINMDLVGKEENGSFSGTKDISEVTYTISGSYSDFTTGEGTLTVSPALPEGNEVMICRPLNLEDANGEKYIQGLKYDTTKRTVKPQENALDVESTFHAQLAFQRNFQLDLMAYSEKDLFRTINADRGYNAIRMMYNASLSQDGAVAVGEDYNNDASKSFLTSPPTGAAYTEQQYIQATFERWLWRNDKAMQDASEYGFLSRMVVGDDIVAIIKMLRPDQFRADPMYVPSHDIIYFGTLFGRYRVFYDSQEKIIPKDEGLLIATSNDALFHNGYLSSTAVPLNSFKFQMTKLMTNHKRLWGRFYRRLDDPKYFRRVKINKTS